MANLFEIIIKGTDQASSILKKIGDAGEDSGNRTHASWAKVGPAMELAGKAAVVGLGAAATAMTGLAAVSVGAAMDFESSMSGIGAVSGATGEELKKLQGLALQLGKDTKYSATEAAKGMEELIKGGVGVEDVLNGAARATLNLAAAGEVELTEAAEIAANAMSMFGLKGKDMEMVSNQIAGAANASSLSVNDFRFSLSAVGAVANTAGQSFQSTAEAIAVMGKMGLKGSDAGTSLKAMLLNLQPSTNASALAMERLGLFTVNETAAVDSLSRVIAAKGEPGMKALAAAQKDGTVSGTELFKIAKKLQVGSAENFENFNAWAASLGMTSNAFFDANGKAKSMAEIAEQLQVATKDLTEQQKLQALETMFGSDAMRAAAVLAKSGAEGFTEMAEAMGKVTAESVASQRLNNLKGSLEQLKGSLETAAITAGMALTPALKGLADSATAAVNGAMPLIEEWAPRLATVLGNVAGTVTGPVKMALEGDLRGALSSVTETITSVVPQIQQKMGEWLKAFTEWIIPMIPVFLENWFVLWTEWMDWLVEQIPLLVATIAQWATEFLAWIEPLIPPMLTKLGIVLSNMLNWLIANAPVLAEKFLSEWVPAAINWLVKAAVDVIPKLFDLLKAITTWVLTEGLPKILELGFKMGQGIIKGIGNGLRKIKVPLPNFRISEEDGPFGIKVPKLHIGVEWHELAKWIPEFAEGGVVSRPTLGIIGEKYQTEIVTPENKMRKIIREEGGVGGGGPLIGELHIHSPEPITPSDYYRQTQRLMRNLAMEYQLA